MSRSRTSCFGVAGGAQSRVPRGIATIVATAVAVALGGGATVLACPVCFGAEETPMIEATQLGILILLAITLSVQGAFVGFFLYLRARAKRVAESELDTEWSELQNGASRAS